MPLVLHSGYWRARGGLLGLLVKRLGGCLGVRIFLPCHRTSPELMDCYLASLPSQRATTLSPPRFHARTSCVLDLRLFLVAYRQPLIYNAEIARELLKQVYVAERLQPPSSFAAITDAYSVLWGRAKNPQYWRDLLATGEWARVAVYAVEAYTIFKVSPFFVSFWCHDTD